MKNIKIENVFVVMKEGTKIKGNAVVNIDGIIVSDVKIIQGKSGLFVGLPSRSYEKDGETKWSDTVRFENVEDQEAVTQAVLNAFYSKRAEMNIAPDGSRVRREQPEKKNPAPAIKSDKEWFDASGNNKSDWGSDWQ